MKEILITIGITWLLRSIADIGIKYSKRTENTVDDIIFNNLKKIANGFSFKKKN